MGLKIKNTSDYKTISSEETLKILETTPDGLSDSQVRSRLAIFGPNEIVEKKNNLLLEFLLRYWGPMPWLLELAMALSFVLRHYLEGIIIFVLLTLNVIIGHMHARGSQKAIELLKQKLAINAKVLRDGKWVTQVAGEIVPGDILVVKLGDIVPADAKIISGELSVDESALTGESLPKDAHPSDVIYSGSAVKRGEARCVVVNTGASTYFGKTAELVKIAKPKSHQEEVMMAVVKYMMYLGIAASILVAIYALFLHLSIVLILTFVVIFLMGAVPVALPAVMTIVQSVGAMELSRKGVLVTRLDSIEDAASIDVLCFDKTGTVTQNILSVIDSTAFPGYQKEDVIRLAALTSRAEGVDLIDLAVIEYAKGIKIGLSAFKQISYTPFNPSLKRTEAIIENNGARFRVIKGAAQIVLALCRGMDQNTIAIAKKTMGDFSQKGYRTIAVARSQVDNLNNLQLVGLLALADPLRPDAKSMIEEARKLGIKPIMLTGDNIAIAQEIARQVGIGDKIIRFSDIAGLSEDEQIRSIEESDGFAEIYPEDKYKIVKLMQSRNHMVGMTGDGVNDAPALKQAEMGIAVSNSTDVAKASASVVLTEPGINVIIHAIEISREIYQRMLTWVINKVTKVIEFVGILTVGFFWLHNIVLSLLGMSLLVFANDFVTMSLATDNVKSTDNPNKWNVKNITVSSLIPGMLLVVEGLIVIVIGTKYFHLEWEKLRTLVMLNLIFNSQFRVLIVRERRHFWASVPGKALLIFSLATIIIFFLLGVYGIFVPALAVKEILIILGFSALFTLGIDFPKYYCFRRFGL
ncbi:MAG: plasma-membrane proton-efflux P-type ATPase [Candidatus Omnitrophica bacterium CG08_land_8_20_14_0_20_41_16]|uniref:Plasma-membrane proton-efflux P-type ATPase n=1 Tax=Candidatus Sherwoodlollariibacterium unditelluris TaxID=1974757 RepID=A0A2G9YLP9_9BACT|nr:MAG: plasma-membrane proton-efflux P-type ATPase [Candidatus Omnitrophica bacterium CG23_combo_of_CG06-09_8_20_14_all_41_10]PIS33291.1 MAG: plasma-membrane proton-efflux P-type ATPase [Candidatus Omnitrophica bacterium CG08_land_8_20_14_0_20_41_16]